MIVAMALAAALGQATAAKQTLGVYDRWGAFAETAPTRCYAIAEPVSRGGTQRPFASIGNWPGGGVRNQIHIRLSRPRDAGAQVMLSIGERRFALRAGRADAWAPDGPAERAIVAALRSARSMSVESVAANGRPFADIYALKGAATAIDAAALACIRR